MLDRNQMKELRVAINKALTPVSQQFSLEKLQVESGTFDPERGWFTFKLEGAASGGVSREQAAYDMWAPVYKLPKHGTPFVYGGKRYKIAGFAARGRKVLASLDGKMFKFPVDVVQRLCA